MEQINLFDFMPNEEAEQWKPKKADDWKWTFADYPQEKNGLKVFFLFCLWWRFYYGI